MSGRYSLNLPVDLKQEAEQAAEEQGVSLNQLIVWSLAEKVTALKARLSDPNFPGIAYKLDTNNQPVPVIRGSGIRVQTIVVAHDAWGESAGEIARQYALPTRMVKEALAFYKTHKKMVDNLIEANNEQETPDAKI